MPVLSVKIVKIPITIIITTPPLFPAPLSRSFPLKFLPTLWPFSNFLFLLPLFLIPLTYIEGITKHFLCIISLSPILSSGFVADIYNYLRYFKWSNNPLKYLIVRACVERQINPYPSLISSLKHHRQHG